MIVLQCCFCGSWVAPQETAEVLGLPPDAYVHGVAFAHRSCVQEEIDSMDRVRSRERAFFSVRFAQ